jgi:hypothetical protein
VSIAKRHYQSGHQAWKEKDGKRVATPADKFIQDVETSLLELLEGPFGLQYPK